MEQEKKIVLFFAVCMHTAEIVWCRVQTHGKVLTVGHRRADF